MALFPNFSAASAIRRTAYPGETASSALTTNLQTELVTNGNWTEPTANTFKSPVDADGRYLQIVVTEPSATRWQWVVENETPTTVCTREVLLSGAGETVNYFSGDNHVWVEVDKAGATADEALGAGLLDLSPEAQDAHTNYVWGRGHRNSAGTADGLGSNSSDFFIFDNGASVGLRRLLDSRNAQATQVRLQTFSGLPIHKPAGMSATNASAVVVYAGRAFDMVSSFQSEGTTFTIAIGDAGETGTFEGVLTLKDGLLSLAVRIS